MGVHSLCDTLLFLRTHPRFEKTSVWEPFASKRMRSILLYSVPKLGGAVFDVNIDVKFDVSTFYDVK